MRSLWSSVNPWLTWFHRWAGVALCLLFAMWFASGAVLHFVGFPSLSTVDRHSASVVIDLSRLSIGPGEAFAKAPTATDLRLVSIGGRPIYVLQEPTGMWVSVAGDTGDVLLPISPPDATRIAERFGGHRSASTSGALDYDQWIVHQHFDPYRPFYRVRLDDPAMTDLYVSASTGEVMQRTTLRQRTWNWSGAVIHWIYFTPLRKSWSVWNQAVWWVSLVALLSSAVGTWLGVIRMAANRAAGRKGLSPFRGWMRWHHLIGLFASVIVITWMLSGWLSMDHGRVFSMGHATDDQAARLSGIGLAETVKGVTLETLHKMSPAAEITFNAIDRQPFVTAYESHTRMQRLVFLNDMGNVLPHIPEPVVLAGVKNVWPDAIAVASSAGADTLYRHAESAGEDAVGFVAGDDRSLRTYIDRLSGRFIVVMDFSRRGYAWIYYGLHTFEFPGLIERPALRTTLVLTLLTLGFIFSATGVVLSVKRLKREFA